MSTKKLRNLKIERLQAFIPLIYKLIIKNFSPPLIKLIFSYLSDRTFHVKINNSLSRQYPATFGLPQDSKISPTLFSIFINDMICLSTLVPIWLFMQIIPAFIRQNIINSLCSEVLLFFPQLVVTTPLLHISCSLSCY